MWQVCDVILCTSSIMHLCTISIDRFIGIRTPMVARNRSRWIVPVKIGFVWFVSLLIASPLYFVVYFSPHEVLDPTLRHCSIMNRPFLVYGSVAAFFVPLIIMLVTYTLSMRSLSGQMALLSQNSFGVDAAEMGSFVVDRQTAENLDEVTSCRRAEMDGGGHIKEQLFVILSRRSWRANVPCGGDPETNLRLKEDEDSCMIASQRKYEKHPSGGKYLKIGGSEASPISCLLEAPSPRPIDEDDPGHRAEVGLPNDSGTEAGSTTSPSRRRWEAKILEIEGDATPPRSGGGDRLARFCRRLLLAGPLLRAIRRRRKLDDGSLTSSSSPGSPRWTTVGLDDSERDQSPSAGVGEAVPLSMTSSSAAPHRFKSLVQKHSAAIRVAGILIAKRERQKKEALHSVRNERKAIRVLGVMFFIFVACWAPFFSVNLAIGICEDCHTGTLLFRTCLWFGYVSSTLNPIVYTVFNRSFRKTFLDIILPQRQCRKRRR